MTPTSSGQELPVSGTLRIGDASIGLEVARTRRQHQIGLACRPFLPADRGMAFVLGAPAAVTLWMKDTLIPLDILFVRDGIVANIAANVPPCAGDPCPSFASDGEVDTVIELPAGRSAELGIVAGDRLVIDYR